MSTEEEAASTSDVERERLRAQVAADLKEFLANGGEIQVIPHGGTGYSTSNRLRLKMRELENRGGRDV